MCIRDSLGIEENGDVDFMVYGYMSRGNHEGYSGVGIYHYNSDQNMVEEKVFIPGTESYEFLKDDLGILSYVNKDNQLFLVMAKDLYPVSYTHLWVRGFCLLLKRMRDVQIKIWIVLPEKFSPFVINGTEKTDNRKTAAE